MDFDAWSGLYRRLCAAKEHAKSGEQCAVYFEALKTFPESCVAQAVFRATREVTGWPKSDVMVALAREERTKLTTTAVKCDVCRGTRWVPGPPRHDFGNTYETVERCPQCYPRSAKSDAQPPLREVAP